jgi:hypothetical protein
MIKNKTAQSEANTKALGSHAREHGDGQVDTTRTDHAKTKEQPNSGVRARYRAHNLLG